MAQWEHFVVQAAILQHPGMSALDIPWNLAEDGSYEMDESAWPEQFGALDMVALQAEAEQLAHKVTRDMVNAEILENLKLIWGGDTETRVAQKHQNAVGIMTRLLNKEGSEQTALTSEEMAVKDSIKGQLEAHEAVLNEGRRIKALSLIPDNYKDLLQAAIPQE